MEKTEQIRFCGFGGQGVVLAGKILGNASISAGKWVAGLSTYGAAARGGVCEADVVISDERIIFPGVLGIGVLIAMSQSAYDKNIESVNQKTGIVVYDSQIVSTKGIKGLKQIGIAATEAAIEELGDKQVANMVILGAAVEITKVIAKEELVVAVEKGVRSRFRDLNLKAMELGFKLGRQALGDVRVTTQREETNVVTERMTTTKMEGRTHIPRLNAEKCVACALCQCLCPDLAVTRDEGRGKSIEIDYNICRGCGVCAFVCPKGAIKMVLEE